MQKYLTALKKNINMYFFYKSQLCKLNKIDENYEKVLRKYRVTNGCEKSCVFSGKIYPKCYTVFVKNMFCCNYMLFGGKFGDIFYDLIE